MFVFVLSDSEIKQKNNQWSESIDEVLKKVCKIDKIEERKRIIQKYHWFQENFSVENMIKKEIK
ncbi:hypothetical protein OSO01_18470 [Oceanobacillus sojae]|uniref:Uncharacterized protein n=1 Tax=Oceanobacillus sojae TaxID=582851 RepID=A0A511ZI36_9BACI|nr:hypothetical protein OSO01_18470 [Oceanobacillus sojae]